MTKKAYRDAFVSSHLSTNIAAQIFALRADLTQEEFAKRAGMAQARIALLEDPNYENPTIATLKRIASAADVALIVRFVPFSDLVRWVTNLNDSVITPQKFENDYAPVIPEEAVAVKSSTQINLHEMSFSSPSIARQLLRADAGDAPKSISTAPLGSSQEKMITVSL